MVRLLLERGADVNARNAEDETALNKAVRLSGIWLNTAIGRNSVDIVQLLLDSGAEVGSTTLGEPRALIDAVNFGAADVVKLLLERGVDINARRYGYDDVLQATVRTGHAHIVRLLLDRGADVNRRTIIGGYTALHEAAAKGHVDLVKLLLEGGADVNALDDDGNAPLHLAASTSVALDRRNLQRDPKPGSPAEYLDVARLLLNGGADVDARNNDGKSALHLLGADGFNHLSIHEVMVDFARLLLEYGAAVNARDSQGKTPLHSVVESHDGGTGRRWDLAQLLLDEGADVHARDISGATALYLAVESGETHGANILRAAGAAEPPLAIEKAWLELPEEGLEGEAARERFQLYNYCRPIDFIVSFNLTNNNSETVQGLTAEDLQAAVESRLRAARLYDSEAPSYLFVYVHLMGSRVGGRHVGWVESTNVSLNKLVWDQASAQRSFASTWERSATGTVPDSAVRESVLGSIRGYMDEFLAEYLRVNEAACE